MSMTVAGWFAVAVAVLGSISIVIAWRKGWR